MDKIEQPGEHPFDPWKKEIDPIGFALERVQTFLIWIEEHRASFEAHRNSDPTRAEEELRYLAHSTREAIRHLQRLTELLLAGYQIDRNKKLPKGLSDPARLARVKKLLMKTQQNKG